jgi:biotin/methionine sulfoxide reductase
MAELAHYTRTHFGVFEVEHAPDGVRLRDTALDIHPGEMRASLVLHLISPQPRYRLHGQLDGNGPSAAAKIRGCEPAYLNPREALKRGIRDGDIIRIFNEFGSVLCSARIVDWIADQVISVETGAWFSPVENGDVTCAHGNPDVLTRDVGCSRLSQGPSPNSALVSAELFTASLPENTVRKAPRFV